MRKILARKTVIPVLTIERLADAVPLAEALVKGGLRVLEITLRSEAALGAIRAIDRQVPRATVGVGTVLRRGDMVAAFDAGARFAVSPGTTPDLVVAAGELDMPLLPGVATASEAMAAADAGMSMVKLFPAMPLGGARYLRSLGGPLPKVKFCPTGGVGADTFPELLALPNVFAVGGSWMAPRDAIEAGDWERIQGLAKETFQKVKEIRG